jgi:hypothetical protein
MFLCLIKQIILDIQASLDRNSCLKNNPSAPEKPSQVWFGGSSKPPQLTLGRLSAVGSTGKCCDAQVSAFIHSSCNIFFICSVKNTEELNIWPDNPVFWKS